jgi:hypothetical protein
MIIRHLMLALDYVCLAAACGSIAVSRCCGAPSRQH